MSKKTGTALVGTFFKKYSDAYDDWNRKEKESGRKKFAIIYTRNPDGYFVVSVRQLQKRNGI